MTQQEIIESFKDNSLKNNLYNIYGSVISGKTTILLELVDKYSSEGNNVLIISVERHIKERLIRKFSSFSLSDPISPKIDRNISLLMLYPFFYNKIEDLFHSIEIEIIKHKNPIVIIDGIDVLVKNKNFNELDLIMISLRCFARKHCPIITSLQLPRRFGIDKSESFQLKV